MTKLCRFAFILMAFVALSGAQRPNLDPGPPRRPVRFLALDVTIDPGATPLAAYQLEFEAKGAEAKLVAVENGEHRAFSEAPYFDPAALEHDRVIIAAFNTGDDLPTGPTRVATLHLALTGEGEPQYSVRLDVAATADGRRIPASVTLSAGEGG